MSNLPTAEANPNLDFGAALQKRARLTECYLKVRIMFTSLGPQPDLFDFNILAGLACFPVAFCPLVLVAAKVHQLDDRGIGVRGNLHQVQLALAGQT